jgi:hypothetical protein
VSGFDEWRPKGSSWDETSELWELQANPRLTVGELRARLENVDPSLPVAVTVYDGTSGHTILVPVEIGYHGDDERPAAVLITAAAI